MKINRTIHAINRCGHRGFREKDLDLIAEYGTITDGGFLLTRNDIMEFERRAKKLLDRLHKLQDAFVPATDDDGRTAKTVFRATRKQRRRQTGRW